MFVSPASLCQLFSGLTEVGDATRAYVLVFHGWCLLEGARAASRADHILDKVRLTTRVEEAQWSRRQNPAALAVSIRVLLLCSPEIAQAEIPSCQD
jgi:hypothetical protein